MTSYTFTSFSYPGATSTYGYGINGSGEFVGTEVGADKVGRGYIDNNGTLAVFNVPGATAVELDSVNVSGNLSGSFRDSAGNAHAFFSSSPNGAVATINYPGATQTFGRGLNSAGYTTGTYDDRAGLEHAYIDSSGSFASFDYPGAKLTDGNAINDAGTLVGGYQAADGTIHGFSESNGLYKSIDFPGAKLTYVTSINNVGQITGIYAENNNQTHAFVFDGKNTYTSFDYPGSSTGTSANGITDAGQIVGSYPDANGTFHTFIATPACYLAGTLIRTVDGDVAVEALRIGDRVVTASGAVRPIRWLGHRAYSSRFARNNPALLPICFAKGSLGEDLPKRDLWVSPKHAMYLDGVLVPAECLLNGETVFKATCAEPIAYHHVELDSHDVLVAEGAPSESYVDDDNRNIFLNAHEYVGPASRSLHRAAVYCAPRVESGFVLQAVRRRMRHRHSVSRSCGKVGPSPSGPQAS